MTAVPSHALVDPGIVVVGAINVDLVVSAASLPKPGETVVGSGPFEHPGGKGANAALAAARAGTRVTLIGAVGHDRMADVALKDLRDVGVDVSGVAVHASVSTGVALIVVDQSGENQIAVGAGANAEVRPDWVTARMSDVSARESAACSSAPRSPAMPSPRQFEQHARPACLACSIRRHRTRRC